MKKMIYIVLLFWCGIAIAAEGVQTQKNRLFILSGQSNMVRLDPELSFTPTLKKAFPGENIVVVKVAKIGQPIRRWSKKSIPEVTSSAKNVRLATGDLYDVMVRQINAGAIKNTATSVTFIWMQGERDAKDGLGDSYATELRGVIDQLKHDIGRDDLYFVLGRLSDFGIKMPTLRGEWEKVRNAQVQIAEADSHGAWVDTDDLNGDKDELHYTREGFLIFGERLAQAAIKQLAK
ncbi:MAG: sialate O-acetylesterase [Methylovulum sp.]|nr:sialate O-acetylesterase [Methylovulum sp.]